MQLQLNEQYTGFDLPSILEGDEGTYLAQQGGQSFICVAVEGHSIKLLRPIGRRINELSVNTSNSPEQWLVTKISNQDISAELDESSPSRARSANR